MFTSVGRHTIGQDPRAIIMSCVYWRCILYYVDRLMPLYQRVVSLRWTKYKKSERKKEENTWRQKHKYSRWNFVAFSHTSWDICFFICTYGLGHHLWLLTHPDTQQCLEQASRVTWHWKHRYSCWNFVAISHTSWDICYSISTSGHRLPSLISHSPRHTAAVFRTVQSCCLTSKTCI